MKKQILIVDDENDCAELLRYHLQKENYETVIARNGKEAVEAVQRHTPDAVLLDIMMPELNGWETCRILGGAKESRCRSSCLPRCQTRTSGQRPSLALTITSKPIHEGAASENNETYRSAVDDQASNPRTGAGYVGAVYGP
jgi:CheY-like chemotaxis protein